MSKENKPKQPETPKPPVSRQPEKPERSIPVNDKTDLGDSRRTVTV